MDKKTTVKLIKKGKINFDGGNSEHEMLELYYWLEYLYTKFASEVLVDVNKISNTYHYDCIEAINMTDAIYSEDEMERVDENADEIGCHLCGRSGTCDLCNQKLKQNTNDLGTDVWLAQFMTPSHSSL